MKAETAHRHGTIDELRATDRESLRLFHEGEKRGQRYALTAIVALLVVVVAALILDRPVVGVSAVVAGAAAIIWAMRRRSDGAQIPSADLDDGDQLEGSANSPS